MYAQQHKRSSWETKEKCNHIWKKEKKKSRIPQSNKTELKKIHVQYSVKIYMYIYLSFSYFCIPKSRNIDTFNLTINLRLPVSMKTGKHEHCMPLYSVLQKRILWSGFPVYVCVIVELSRFSLLSEVFRYYIWMMLWRVKSLLTKKNV